MGVCGYVGVLVGWLNWTANHAGIDIILSLFTSFQFIHCDTWWLRFENRARERRRVGSALQGQEESGGAGRYLPPESLSAMRCLSIIRSSISVCQIKKKNHHYNKIIPLCVSDNSKGTSGGTSCPTAWVRYSCLKTNQKSSLSANKCCSPCSGVSIC